ncbi:polysaccharide deacetylase family protein [Clostridium oceanicum]|uniref:Polysaccharide deacetylase family protein n=1 Tax=Clostridium oceanicum TaxID=1543 RepID=A0ABP3UYS1_9CLOT
MIFKKYFISLFLLLFIIVNLNFSNVYAKSNKSKVLFVYNREKYFGANSNLVKSIKELLGHFSVDVKTKNLEDYDSTDLNKYDVVIVSGIHWNSNYTSFIKDIKSYKNKIFWIGDGIQSLIESDKKYGLEYLGKNSNMSEIYYTNNRKYENISSKSMKKFLLSGESEFNILKVNDKNTNVLSYISDGENSYPFAFNIYKLWYVSRVESSSILFYVFSDILNDVFEVKNFSKDKAFVRIEDVHPYRDVNKLKEIADYLYKENVPFMIALIPVYVNPDTDEKTFINEKKEFKDAIRYMQKKGGSVILHGYTHQHYKGKTSGEGFEFWNGEEDAPLKLDMKKYVHDRVLLGVKECLKNGIYPLGYEAPHYAMDSVGYKELKKYFSTYVGQYQSSDMNFTTTAYPYTLKDTDNFNKLIPENLGYVDHKDPYSVEKIIRNYEKLSIVRGNVNGFFFHPFEKKSDLKKIIDYLKSKKIDFIDLKKEENWVQIDNIKVNSRNNKITSLGVKLLDEEKNNSQKLNNKSKYINNINSVVIIIVCSFSIILFILFLVLRKIDKKKFLR